MLFCCLHVSRFIINLSNLTHKHTHTITKKKKKERRSECRSLLVREWPVRSDMSAAVSDCCDLFILIDLTSSRCVGIVLRLTKRKIYTQGSRSTCQVTYVHNTHPEQSVNLWAFLSQVLRFVGPVDGVLIEWSRFHQTVATSLHSYSFTADWNEGFAWDHNAPLLLRIETHLAIVNAARRPVTRGCFFKQQSGMHINLDEKLIPHNSFSWLNPIREPMLGHHRL